MTAAEWADAMLARGNARGRAQRELDDPDADMNPKGTASRFDGDESRRIIFRCIKCGNALRKIKHSGTCDRCEKLYAEGKIR